MNCVEYILGDSLKRSTQCVAIKEIYLTFAMQDSIHHKLSSDPCHILSLTFQKVQV